MRSIIRFLTMNAMIFTFCLCVGSGTSAATPLQVTALGGWKNVGTFVPHVSGSTYEFSEDVVVDFNKVLNFSTVRYSITPSTPTVAESIGDARATGDGVLIHVRKVPGTTYTITIPLGIKATDGSTLVAPYSFRIVVPPAPNIPLTARSTKGQPYRFGILSAGGSTSLGPPNDAQNIAYLSNVGARFVRIDYDGQDIEPTKGTFNWGIPDKIMDELQARGITELPILEQIGAPKWARGSYSLAVWSYPQDYADFAKAVAAHVAAKYPQITRLSLMNEPNLEWINANSQYASKDGSAVGIYAKTAYAAIKSVAPAMTVVGPAIVPAGTDVHNFLNNMYKVGCRRGNCWDVLAINNYAWYNPTFSSAYTSKRWDIYKDLQAIAAQHGDSAAHVMLTEWGYSIDPNSPFAFDSRIQAYYLAVGFNLMLNDPTVDSITWPRMVSPVLGNFYSLTSLVNYNGGLLPAYAAYQHFATY